MAPEDDAPRLQRFFEANPEYFHAVNGEPPAPDVAREEFAALPPDGWAFEKKWLLGFEDRGGALIAMADVISGLFVPQVWHLGLFIVAKSYEGKGLAPALCRGLEEWMRSGGARWSRLGVVEGNARAERFWQKLGYLEVRKRPGMKMGRNTNTVRVMAKPLAGGTLAEYFSLVERDRLDQ
jgi:GNAT superfamily N-acetyltransferase